MVQEAPKMKKALPANAQASLDNMVRALDQAVRSGQDLGNNPNPALLWQVQEGLVRYALSYEELLDELK